MVLWEQGCVEGRQKELAEDDVKWQALLLVCTCIHTVLLKLQVLLPEKYN